MNIKEKLMEKAKKLIEEKKEDIPEIHLAEKPYKTKLTSARKKNLVAERNYVCEKCDKRYKLWVFEVHHIIPREYKECNEEDGNLMVLCANCHKEFSHAWDEVRRMVKNGGAGTVTLSMEDMKNMPEIKCEVEK